jgi:hypothetical protein
VNNWKTLYGHNVVENGRNWNCLRLLTGLGQTRRGHRLDAINISFKEESVLIILKKSSPKGPQVAFLEAKDLDDALYVMGQAIKSKTVPWKTDKFRSIRSDKA